MTSLKVAELTKRKTGAHVCQRWEPAVIPADWLTFRLCFIWWGSGRRVGYRGHSSWVGGGGWLVAFSAWSLAALWRGAA